MLSDDDPYSHVSSGLSPGKWPDNRKSMSLLNGKHKSRIHEWVISGAFLW